MGRRQSGNLKVTRGEGKRFQPSSPLGLFAYGFLLCYEKQKVRQDRPGECWLGRNSTLTKRPVAPGRTSGKGTWSGLLRAARELLG